MNDGSGFRERWDMPAWFGRPMFIFRAPAAPEDIATLDPVTPSIVIGHLEGWLLDVQMRRKLLDALESISSTSAQSLDNDEYESLLGFVRSRLVPRSRSLARVGQTSGPAARAAAPARN